MRRYLYSEWDATQDISDPDANELMDELGRELISSGDVSDSLSQMQQEGIEDSQGKRLPGVQEMLEQLSRKKQEQTAMEQAVSDNRMTEEMASEGELTSESDEDSRNEEITDTETQKRMEMLDKIDELEKQFQNSKNTSLDGIDEQLVREILGDETAEQLEQLKEIPRTLNEEGYISLTDTGYELTPRGMRKIGQKALEDIFAQLRKDRGIGHNNLSRGAGGERIDETKKFQSGDSFKVHLHKTIMNALKREHKTPPINLEAGDFEVFKTTGMARSATVLMLDLSFSMPARDHFEAAKKVAIALDGLIRTQYPKDTLHIVGFSSFARQLKKEDLSRINWDEFDNYTNIQHGLYIARKLLSKERCANRQIILVTDGEPTAHFEDESHFFYQAPPSPRTLQLTLREVRNCTKNGIVINTFMLESDPLLSAFVTKMARINKGRIFFTSANTLGQYLIVDYISRKKRFVLS